MIKLRKLFIVFALVAAWMVVGLVGCGSSKEKPTNGSNGGSSILPNPAKFYTKWNSWKDSVEWSQEDKENAVRYTELIFAVPLGEIEHMRALKQMFNPDLQLLRYINIWPRGTEKLAQYTDQMVIHRDWPN